MIHTRVSDDHDYMVKAATEALTRPSHFIAWDERLFHTHGLVMTWAERGDDLIAESNYLVALSMLEGAVAHDESGASEERGDDVIDGSSSHWLVGSMREIYVRVYDDAGAFTPAFREAVDIAAAIREYPILDESDYSEREYEAWMSTFDDALDQAVRDHGADSAADQQCIDAVMSADRYARMPEMGHPGDLSWDDVATAYDSYRADHFEWLAARQLPYARDGVLPGQEPIPGVLVTA